jgi:hypothetical protein
MEHFVIDTYNWNLVILYKRLVGLIIIIGAVKVLLYRFSKFTLGRDGRVLRVTNGRDGRVLRVSNGRDGRVLRVSNGRDGRVLRISNGRDGRVLSVSNGRDGRVLRISNGGDGRVLSVSSGSSEIPSGLRRRYKVKSDVMGTPLFRP